ncbi:MAG: 16S rRNA (adenine(1518)-N(6)/adenine(1519)-N(6))-dimethyltransferase RsmA [Myxococcales bacterium]|nr:16S rRNA (adenine(1518)-N(6)/adenine(1519)-N(6))-dimethyltransferase RsmA [Myxococcales bacterium]
MSEGALTYVDPRVLLKRHGLTASRRYSQNFLISRHVLEAIAEATCEGAAPAVVELGAGLGTLSAELMRRGCRVLAIERDPRMLEVLRAELVPAGLKLQPGDAAHVDYRAAATELGATPRVVGNLPYAITGAILRDLIEACEFIERAVIMVQREVAERLLADPGSGQYGALSVFTQAAFAIERVVKAPPTAFHPPPRVHSQVLRLRPLSPPRAQETPALRATVRAAFQGRRKTLLNALSTLGPKDAVAQALRACDIDAQRRGETLAVEDFARLAQALQEGGIWG